MTLLKSTMPCVVIAVCLAGSLAACQPNSETTDAASNADIKETSQTAQAAQPLKVEVETLAWEDLMPAGEDERLEALYAEFYDKQEKQYREQVTLMEAGQSNPNDANIMSSIEEGSALDTMDQIGTYNVVQDLNGAKVRMPGYVVPLDFNAASEYDEFLLVPYFGACLHTPPPPPNQIVFVKATEAKKIADINEPVWIEGTLKTGQFGSDLGNSAYELTLSKLEPYEY